MNYIFFITLLCTIFLNYSMQQDENDTAPKQTDLPTEIKPLTMLAKKVITSYPLKELLSQWEKVEKCNNNNKVILFENIVEKISTLEGDEYYKTAYIYNDTFKKIATDPFMRKFVQLLWLYSKSKIPYIKTFFRKNILYSKIIHSHETTTLQISKDIAAWCILNNDKQYSILDIMSALCFFDFYVTNNNIECDPNTLDLKNNKIVHLVGLNKSPDDQNQQFNISNIPYKDGVLSTATFSNEPFQSNLLKIKLYMLYNKTTEIPSSQKISFTLHIKGNESIIEKTTTFSNPIIFTKNKAGEAENTKEISCEYPCPTITSNFIDDIRKDFYNFHKVYTITLNNGKLTPDEHWVDFDDTIKKTYETLKPEALILLCKAITSCLPNHKKFSVDSSFWETHSAALPEQLKPLVIARKKCQKGLICWRK